MIEIIGAPFDVCGKRLGSRLGPIAMRLEGLVDGLRRLGHDVTDTGAVFDLDAWVPKSDSDRYARANEAYREITNRVAGAHRNGGVPFVIGGDHSISIGSIAGALRKY
ncbi:MAG TPA: arginase family protein, partial [Fimbriimonadaceae bacterium]|nr:arginase family protein [Fimbriimonadaceae bacterium]